MKKIFLPALIFCVVFISGCTFQDNESVSEYSTETDKDMDTIEFNGISIKIPSEWEMENNEPWFYYYPDSSDKNNMLMLMFYELDWSQVDSYESACVGFYNGLNGGSVKVLKTESLANNNIKGTEVFHLLAEHTGDNYTGNVNVYQIPVNDGYVALWFETDMQSQDKYNDIFAEILDSIEADVNITYKN